MIREAEKEDLAEILRLYLYLHETEVPQQSEHLAAVWDSILADKNHHLIVNVADGRIVSSCVCIIIPNLTRDARPYALLENVVTHGDYRGRGYAADCLHYAKEIARKENCYKMMLFTGSKEQKVLQFYRNAGFSSADKTAFLLRMD